MAKIMLVEDDKSLREIYSIRLVAEGYEIVSAGDGEEALGLAVREKPDLIISDVMMPKISGFDMLDIIRSAPETKSIKVIIMTALSSDEQRVRSESLGAEKHLVKSQCGIEDVINAVHEVLGDKPSAAPANAEAQGNTAAVPAVNPNPAPAAPVEPTAAPAATQPQQAIEPQQVIAPSNYGNANIPPAPVTSAYMAPAPETVVNTTTGPVQPQAVTATPQANAAPVATPMATGQATNAQNPSQQPFVPQA